MYTHLPSMVVKNACDGRVSGGETTLGHHLQAVCNLKGKVSSDPFEDAKNTLLELEIL